MGDLESAPTALLPEASTPRRRRVDPFLASSLAFMLACLVVNGLIIGAIATSGNLLMNLGWTLLALIISVPTTLVAIVLNVVGLLRSRRQKGLMAFNFTLSGFGVILSGVYAVPDPAGGTVAHRGDRTSRTDVLVLLRRERGLAGRSAELVYPNGQ
jgi:hypothetical protein